MTEKSGNRHGPDAPIGEEDLVAYTDGRLSQTRAEAVEAWLDANPIEAARVGRDGEISGALRDALAAKLDEPVPLQLRIDTIDRAVRDERRRRWRRIAAVLVVFVSGGIAGWFVRDGGMMFGNGAPPPGEFVADATLAHRTYTAERRHAVEVAAAEQKHLTTWLGNRLRHTFTAPDLTGQGFRLMGGRLLPSVAGPAGQLMYENEDGLRATIYLRPESGEGVAFRFAESGGETAFYWVENGLAYSLTADLPRESIMILARSAYRQLGGERPLPD